MAGLKIVIEEMDKDVFSIKATENGECVYNTHQYIYPTLDMIDNMDVITAWLKSDLNKLRSPVKNKETSYALCLECKSEMWGGYPFVEGKIYPIQSDNFVYDCTNFRIKRELQWNGNIAVSNSTKSKFILVKNYGEYEPFVKSIRYTGKIVCLERLGEPKYNTFYPGEVITFHNGKLTKQTLNGVNQLFGYSSFKQVQKSFSSKFRFAELIDEDTVYNDVFICVETKDKTFEPGMLYFVKGNELFSPIGRTVHNKEEVIEMLTKIGVNVKKVNWE